MTPIKCPLCQSGCPEIIKAKLGRDGVDESLSAIKNQQHQYQIGNATNYGRVQGSQAHQPSRFRQLCGCARQPKGDRDQQRRDRHGDR